MSAATDPAGDVFAFLDARLRAAVQAAVARGADPHDALRGLYISDEQAVALAADGGEPPAPPALIFAAKRLGLGAIDRLVLALCAAPELDPRFGRLYAYLHDDVTRKLASPRLTADLLSDATLAPGEILARFAPGAPLSRRGAIRLLSGEAATTLADRQVKVADRLAAFLLGAVELASAPPCVTSRRTS